MKPQNDEPPRKKELRIRDDSRCCECGFLYRKRAKSCVKKIISEKNAADFFATYGVSLKPNQSLCQKCFTKIRLKKCNVKGDPPQSSSTPNENYASTSNSQLSDQPSTSSQSTSQESKYSLYSPDESESTVPKTEFINMPFDRVISSHGYCFICKSKDDLIDVPLEARIQVFVERRVFIPKRNRCCESHLIKKKFYLDELPKMVIFSNESFIDVDEINLYLEKLSNTVQYDVHGKIGTRSMSDERIKALTGHSWDSIDKLTEKLGTMRKSQNRDLTQAMVMFLMKLRSGTSDSFISAVLDVHEYVVNESINSVLECFRTTVLPKNFGIPVYDRKFLLTQQARVVNLLFDYSENCLILICDGTYLRHEKSTNNAYQRISFSGQKKTPLCKPFTISTTNGFIIDLAGPFEANLNDAQILRNLLEDPHGLISILKKGDVFVLDRGFRDVKLYLEEMGFKVLMPALKGQRKQLTTKESNESRFVTKIRWVVEAAHGILSQKCELLHKFRNVLLPHAAVYCKAACLIYNLTAKRLNADSENLDDIVGRMKSRKAVENTLAITVAEKNYSRRTKPFQSSSSKDFEHFPQLSDDDLKLLFSGSYQLKQALSYLGELLDADNQLQLRYLLEDKGLLKFEVRSRHKNSKTYKLFIQYDQNEDGLDAIKAYCCECPNGLRTVGCCSHVAAIIYFLSNGRFLSKNIRPAEKLSFLFKVDNVIPVINEDSDED